MQSSLSTFAQMQLWYLYTDIWGHYRHRAAPLQSTLSLVVSLAPGAQAALSHAYRLRSVLYRRVVVNVFAASPVYILIHLNFFLFESL